MAFVNGLAISITSLFNETSLDNNNFFNNSIIQKNAKNSGSVIYLENPGNISITNSIFSRNIGMFGTCLFYSETSLCFSLN